MLALLALAVLSPSPHAVGAPTATPDAVRPRLTKGVARPLFLELLRLLDDYAALASADAIPEPNSSRSDAVSAPDTPAARRG